MAIRLALAQLKPILRDVAGNVATVCQYLQECKDKADIVVFPELMLSGYDLEKDAICSSALAESSDHIRIIADAVAKAGVAATVSFPERDSHEPTAVYITTLVFDRDGAIVHKHRKTHLWGRENAVFRAGDGSTLRPFTFTWSPHKFAVAICFEMEFPEVARILALSGANVLLYCAACSNPDPTYADVLTSMGRVRAVENSVFVAYCNQGCDGVAPDSFVATPLGNLAHPPLKPGDVVLTATIDPDDPAIAIARARNPYLTSRKPELYSALVHMKE